MTARKKTKKIDDAEFSRLLTLHKRYLNHEQGGKCLKLAGADLRKLNIKGADLRYADLHGSNFGGMDLQNAKFQHADLKGAILARANLKDAILTRADLKYADLTQADLTRAEVEDANLSYANLSYANLTGVSFADSDLTRANMQGVGAFSTNFCAATLSEVDFLNAAVKNANFEDAEARTAKHFPFIPSVPPDAGSFIGWKKAYGAAGHPYVVKLLIPADAKRSSGMGRKCRCSKAKVLAIESLAGRPSKILCVHSTFKADFTYRIGKTVKAENFDDNRFRECAPGIHFFVNREEAVQY